MKKLYKLLFLALLSVTLLFSFSFVNVSARENVTEWYVKDFDSEIIVNNDSSLNITETIIADCGNLDGKHGIFRVLPKTYKTTEGYFNIPIELISITDENGDRIKYTKTSGRDTVTYKIGDPNVEVQGENTYIIKYIVNNAIRTSDESRDELYWNVLGNYWDMEIDNFEAKIIFPEGINKDNSEVYLYSGSLNNEKNDLADYSWENSNRLDIKSNRTINKREGITISVAFPKDIVTPYNPPVKEKVVNTVREYNPPISELANPFRKFLFPTLFILLAVFLWYKYGRDPKPKNPIVTEFEPPNNLTPLEMGTILNDSGLHKNSLTATIIHLAVLGYLKIEEVEAKNIFVGKDYKLIKTEKDGSSLYEYEKFVFDKLFKDKKEIRLKKLKYSNFSRDITGLSGKLRKDLKSRDLIDKKSNLRQIAMIIAGVLLIVISFGSLLIVSGFVFIFLGIYMRRLTPKGADLKRRIKGFKLYLDTAEKYRSRFYEKENMLEEVLPYAIFFGITKKWLKKMRDIYGDEYFKNHQLSFVAGAFVLSDFSSFESAISNISSSVSSHVSSSSSGMSGGGSVGGGAGGGGGGGW